MKLKLAASPDRFQGLACELQTLQEEEDVQSTDEVIDDGDNHDKFRQALKHTVERWRTQHYRGIWMKIPKAMILAGYTEAFLQEGFEMHHAMSDYLMLTKWLPNQQEDPDMMPNFATHFIGVGGLVMNQRKEILLVQEKFSLLNTTPMWKLPGGLVDPHERLSTAVEREVYEETGIRAKFQHISCFRHNPVYRMNRNDIYFVCLLTLEDDEIPEPTPDPKEISNATWMRIEDYFCRKDSYAFNRQLVALALAQTRIGKDTIQGIREYTIPKKFPKQHCTEDLYALGHEVESLPRVSIEDVPESRTQPNMLLHPDLRAYLKEYDYDSSQGLYYERLDDNGKSKSTYKRVVSIFAMVATLGYCLLHTKSG